MSVFLLTVTAALAVWALRYWWSLNAAVAEVRGQQLYAQFFAEVSAAALTTTGARCRINATSKTASYPADVAPGVEAAPRAVMRDDAAARGASKFPAPDAGEEGPPA